jgi:hypothetical protein
MINGVGHPAGITVSANLPKKRVSRSKNSKKIAKIGGRKRFQINLG